MWAGVRWLTGQHGIHDCADL